MDGVPEFNTFENSPAGEGAAIRRRTEILFGQPAEHRRRQGDRDGGAFRVREGSADSEGWSRATPDAMNVSHEAPAAASL